MVNEKKMFFSFHVIMIKFLSPIQCSLSFHMCHLPHQLPGTPKQVKFLPSK
jgi:hypothetical protein